MGTFVELAAIPDKDKELDGTPERMNGAGKTAGAACETRQIVTEFGIIGFDSVGLAFVGEGLVQTRMINECVIGRKFITEVEPRGRCLVHDSLHDLGGAFPDDIPPDNTATGTVYRRHKVDDVFLCPTNV